MFKIFAKIYILNQFAKEIFILNNDLNLFIVDNEYHKIFLFRLKISHEINVIVIKIKKQSLFETRNTIKSLCVYYNVESREEDLNQINDDEM